MAGWLYVALLALSCLVNIPHTAGSSCDDKQNVYPCVSTARCYSVKDRCDHFDDCGDNSDEFNCTSYQDSDAVKTRRMGKRSGSLAWLVTPVIFGLGCVYAVYKCFKDGLCNCRKLRRRQRGSHNGSYFALDRISFYSLTQIPCTHLSHSRQSSQRSLTVVHNQCFSVSLGEIPPPSGNAQQNLAYAPTPPPTYDEAMSARARGFVPVSQEDPDLPPYTEAVQIDPAQDNPQVTTADNAATYS